MIFDAFKLKSLPGNFLKFVSADPVAHKKMAEEIEIVSKKKGVHEFEIILNKSLIMGEQRD